MYMHKIILFDMNIHTTVFKYLFLNKSDCGSVYIMDSFVVLATNELCKYCRINIELYYSTMVYM